MHPFGAPDNPLNEPVTLLRILSIVFPVLAIALVGWAYGKRRGVEMGGANQLNMAIFIPALVFSALADKSFTLAGHWNLALGAFLMAAGSGVIGYLLAPRLGIAPKVLVITMMFNNCGNLTDVVPFLVEDELVSKGGQYFKVADWQPYAIRDGLLITGQNPASSAAAAQALVACLGGASS